MKMENSKKIEEILNSLDGCERVPAPDFFYTRLKAKIERSVLPESSRSWLLRPVYVMAGVLVVMLVNAFVLFSRSSSTTDSTPTDAAESIQAIAAEYSLNDNSSLYDINQEK